MHLPQFGDGRGVIDGADGLQQTFGGVEDAVRVVAGQLLAVGRRVGGLPELGGQGCLGA